MQSSQVRLWSLLGSTILNAVAWWTFFAHVSALRADDARDADPIAVSSSRLRIERRPARRPPPPARPATLTLPAGWSQQDFGNMAGTNTTVWLDWTKAGKNFIPHVLVGDLPAAGGYMRADSLQAAVRDRLAGLRAGGAKIEQSAPMRVCRGTRAGWFFSYAKLWDDPPLRFDEALSVAGGRVTMAVYMRPAGQPEDARTRAALAGLCSGA